MFAELFFFFQARVVSTQPLLLVYERALDVGQRGPQFQISKSIETNGSCS